MPSFRELDIIKKKDDECINFLKDLIKLPKNERDIHINNLCKHFNNQDNKTLLNTHFDPISNDKNCNNIKYIGYSSNANNNSSNNSSNNGIVYGLTIS